MTAKKKIESPIELSSRVFWAQRKRLSRFQDAAEWFRWQTELDNSKDRRARNSRMPVKQRLEALNSLLDNKIEECTNICKGMYFCSLKKGHKGKHSDQGLLFWTTSEGWYP